MNERTIVYKKKDKWNISSDNDWLRVEMSDKEWYNQWQWMTTSGTTIDNEWKPPTKSGNFGYFSFLAN